jgi:hypothetical protein
MQKVLTGNLHLYATISKHLPSQSGLDKNVQYLLCKTEEEEKNSLKDPKGANNFHIQIKIERNGNYFTINSINSL